MGANFAVHHWGGWQSLAGDGLGQHVFGQHQHHRAGAALQRRGEGTGDVFRDAAGIVNALHPLGHAARAGAEELAEIHFLEGFAVAHIAAHITDQHHHGRRILERGVDADGGIGGAGAARNHQHAGLAGELAVGVGHEAGAAFLAAGDEADAITVSIQAVQHVQIAFTGYAKRHVHALGDQAFHNQMAGTAGFGNGGHGLVSFLVRGEVIRECTGAAALRHGGASDALIMRRMDGRTAGGTRSAAGRPVTQPTRR